MALINRHKPSDTDTPGVLRVGSLSEQAYAEHARSPGVQQLLAEARASWALHYGEQPEAPRSAKAS